MKTRCMLLILSWAVFCPAVFGARAKVAEAGVGLTVYNDNFAVVKERRRMDFKKGVNTVKFVGVASAIDPTSVNFKCLSSPDGVSILEQNYEYDLVNTCRDRQSKHHFVPGHRPRGRRPVLLSRFRDRR